MRTETKGGINLPDRSCWDQVVHYHVNWHNMLLSSRLMTGYSAMAAFSLDTVRNNSSSTLLGRLGCDDVHASQDICKIVFILSCLGCLKGASAIPQLHMASRGWTRKYLNGREVSVRMMIFIISLLCQFQENDNRQTPPYIHFIYPLYRFIYLFIFIIAVFEILGRKWWMKKKRASKLEWNSC